MVNQCTKCEVSRFTRCEAMNGVAKCTNWCSWGRLWVTQGRRSSSRTGSSPTSVTGFRHSSTSVTPQHIYQLHAVYPRGPCLDPWVSSPTLTTSQPCPTGTSPFSDVRRRHTALRQQLTRQRRVCARPPDQLCLWSRQVVCVASTAAERRQNWDDLVWLAFQVSQTATHQPVAASRNK